MVHPNIEMQAPSQQNKLPPGYQKQQGLIAKKVPEDTHNSILQEVARRAVLDYEERNILAGDEEDSDEEPLSEGEEEEEEEED